MPLIGDGGWEEAWICLFTSEARVGAWMTNTHHARLCVAACSRFAHINLCFLVFLILFLFSNVRVTPAVVNSLSRTDLTPLLTITSWLETASSRDFKTTLYHHHNRHHRCQKRTPSHKSRVGTEISTWPRTYNTLPTCSTETYDCRSNAISTSEDSEKWGRNYKLAPCTARNLTAAS